MDPAGAVRPVGQHARRRRRGLVSVRRQLERQSRRLALARRLVLQVSRVRLRQEPRVHVQRRQESESNVTLVRHHSPPGWWR